MLISPLGDLNPASWDWTIHVYVSRLWQHRGNTDDGPIKHTDIVFQDTQLLGIQLCYFAPAGHHMYAEIAQGLVNQFMNRIEEGKVYELRRFLVCQKKSNYKPVDGQFILRFGRYTTVQEFRDTVMEYPLCTYALTPIDDLPRPSDYPETFTDVIGIITGVSPTSQYHSASRSIPSTKRVIYLSDLSGFQISVVLWGERAIAFDGEHVLQSAAKGPVVIIFVGTLVKPFEGRRGLSGGAPCRWYINEDLPEINELRAQLKDQIPIVQGISIPGQTATEISAQVDLEIKNVKELLNLNIWEHTKTKFYCTATITKDNVGGFMHVQLVIKELFHSVMCTSVLTRPVMARAECLAGKELVGKASLTLLRSKVPHGMPLEDAIQFACTDQTTPRELATIVSKKYGMVVSVTSRSFDPECDRSSYQVHRIDTDYGKQPRSSALGRKPGLTLASSNNSSGSGLNPLGQALAEELNVSQNNSSDTAAVLPDPPVSADLAASAVGSGTVLPLTPPSVVKPSGPSKDVIVSSVKKALLQESPPRSGFVDVLQPALTVESEKAQASGAESSGGNTCQEEEKLKRMLPLMTRGSVVVCLLLSTYRGL